MADRGTESVSVTGGDRVAVRDYYETRTRIEAPGATFVVGEATHDVEQQPELGACKKCKRLIWIHALRCPVCAFDPAVEAERLKNEALGRIGLVGFAWMGASALVHRFGEFIGVAQDALVKFGFLGGAIMLAIGAYVWYSRPPWVRRLFPRDDD